MPRGVKFRNSPSATRVAAKELPQNTRKLRVLIGVIDVDNYGTQRGVAIPLRVKAGDGSAIRTRSEDGILHPVIGWLSHLGENFSIKEGLTLDATCKLHVRDISL